MKQTPLMAAALVVGAAGLCFLAAQNRRLGRRLGALEQQFAQTEIRKSDPAPANFGQRLAELNGRVTVLETALEKYIVRQGLDRNLKNLRDMPAGF